MSERSNTLLLQDIMEAIQKILSYTEGYTLSLYEADSRTKEAVERNFEIIGEAAGRVSDDLKMQNQQIEWRVIKDFRNVIIHDYFGINNQIVWETIERRLPDLLQDITALLKSLSTTN